MYVVELQKKITVDLNFVFSNNSANTSLDSSDYFCATFINNFKVLFTMFTLESSKQLTCLTFSIVQLIKGLMLKNTSNESTQSCWIYSFLSKRRATHTCFIRFPQHSSNEVCINYSSLSSFLNDATLNLSNLNRHCSTNILVTLTQFCRTFAIFDLSKRTVSSRLHVCVCVCVFT